MVTCEAPDTFAVLDDQSRVTIFDSGKQVFENMIQGAKAMEFSLEGKYLHIGTQNGQLITIDVNDGNILRTEVAHGGSLNAIAYIPTKKHIITAGDDRSLKVWDAVSGQELREAATYVLEPIKRIAVSPSNQRIVAFGASIVNVYSPMDDSTLQLSATSTLTHSSDHVVFLRNEERVFVADESTISILDSQRGERLFSFPLFDVSIAALGILDDVPHAVYADGTLQAWMLN